MEEIKNNPVQNVLELVTNNENSEYIKSFEEFAVILSLEDKTFSVISELVLDEIEKGLHDSNYRASIARELSAAKLNSADLQQLLVALDQELETMNGLSDIKKDFLKRFFSLIFNSISDYDLNADVVSIPIELCHPDAKIPTYANIGDAGMDIYALDDYVIAPGETKLIPTGIKVAIPLGYELQVRPKSGRALKTKLRVANTPGTIDSGYRSEVGVIIENVEPPIKNIDCESDSKGNITISSIEFGSNFYITKGEKFAQLVLNKIPTARFYQVNNIQEYEGDRGGGFGSTGLK